MISVDIMDVFYGQKRVSGGRRWWSDREAWLQTMLFSDDVSLSCISAFGKLYSRL